MSRKKEQPVDLAMALAVLRRRRADPEHPDEPLSLRLSELSALGVGSGRAWEMRTGKTLREMGWVKNVGVMRYGVLGNWWSR